MEFGVRILAIISIILHVSYSLSAQDLSYKHYSVKDGLPGTTVYQALQDRNGFMWFATAQGVSRFDGRAFKNFSREDGLPDDEVIKLYLDHNNNVWFISLLGIPSVFHNDSIVRFDNCEGINSICEDVLSDSIYLNSSIDRAENGRHGRYVSLNTPGRWKFSGKFSRSRYDFTILRTSSPGKVNFYVSNSKEEICTATLKASTWEVKHIFPSQEILPFTNFSFASFSPSGTGIVILTLDSIYHATRYKNTGLIAFKDFLKTSRDVASIFYEDDSTLWLCTRNEGLLRIRNFQHPNRKITQFFSKNYCTSITKDNEGGYWVTTHADGVYYLPNLQFGSIPLRPEFAEKNAKCIRVLDDHTLAAGFDDGNFMIIEPRVPQSVPLTKWHFIEKNKRILAILPLSNKKFLVSGDAGMFKCSRDGACELVESWQALKEAYFLPDSTCMVAFTQGIAPISNRHMLEQRLFFGRSTCINGIGWKYYWGTLRGAYTISNDTVINLGEKHKELQTVINHIDFAPDSSVWFSTQNGVTVMKNNVVTLISKTHGLASNISKHVSFHGNTAWVSTNNGISRIDYLWNGTLLSYSITNIMEDDGLTSNDINQTTVSGDYLWAATGRGITYFARDYIGHSVSRPPINITRIAVGKKKLPLRDTIVLTYPEKTLRIELAGISYRSGKNIAYEYRLKGLDDRWNRLSTNTLEFTELPFGKFVLEVQAIDRWGEKSPMPRRIAIVNIAPFWKSTLFVLGTYLAIAALIGIAFYAFYKRQQTKKEEEYQLKKKMHELEMKAFQAQINPHFIFNCLTSIQYHIVRADVRNASIYLHKFSTLIRQNLQHSMKSTILLREEIKTLSLYLELEKLRMGERMEYHIVVSDDSRQDRLHIPTMIIQPYVENAIRHGISPLKDRTGVILVRIIVAGPTIDCFIEDNGPGINSIPHGTDTVVHDHVSMGTSITAHRIETINATQQEKITVNIINKQAAGIEGSGTIVRIIFPIQTQ